MTLPEADPSNPAEQVGQVPATQTLHPWRATVRTVFAAVVALLPFLPAIASEVGLTGVGWVAAGLAITGGVTRVLAIPGVQEWMQRYLPWLSATPRQ